MILLQIQKKESSRHTLGYLLYVLYFKIIGLITSDPHLTDYDFVSEFLCK